MIDVITQMFPIFVFKAIKLLYYEFEYPLYKMVIKKEQSNKAKNTFLIASWSITFIDPMVTKYMYSKILFFKSVFIIERWFSQKMDRYKLIISLYEHAQKVHV